MLKRRPTRIELKAEDATEYDELKKRQMAAAKISLSSSSSAILPRPTRNAKERIGLQPQPNSSR